MQSQETSAIFFNGTLQTAHAYQIIGTDEDFFSDDFDDGTPMSKGYQNNYLFNRVEFQFENTGDYTCTAEYCLISKDIKSGTNAIVAVTSQNVNASRD